MEADIRGKVDTVCKIKGIVRHLQIFRESVISLPQPDDQSLVRPAYKIVPAEIGLPCVDLVYIEASQRKHSCSEFKKIHPI